MVLAYLLLGVAQAFGLLLVAIGAPGVWVQLASIAGFAWWTGFQPISPIPILILATLALTADVVAASTGASRLDSEDRTKMGVMGILAGGAGAIVGLRFPLVGSLFGGLIGTLVGTAAGLIRLPPASRAIAGTFSLWIATSMRTATGIAVAVFTTLTLLR